MITPTIEKPAPVVSTNGPLLVLSAIPLVVLISLLLGSGCRCGREGAAASTMAHDDGGPMTPVPGEGASASSGESHHPPIDCPLRKQGVDPHEMRPFEEVEDYIAFLEREDRAVWQRPDVVVKALGLQGDETVVDLGAGSGYFTFRLAKALPLGKVVAIDIEPEMIRHVHHKAMTEEVDNVEVVLARTDDPSLPSGADLVFICDVLHHVRGREVWLAKLASKMRSGAKLVLVEFREGDLPEGPPESIKIPKAELIAMVTGAGFVMSSDQGDLLPYQTFLVFLRR